MMIIAMASCEYMTTIARNPVQQVLSLFAIGGLVAVLLLIRDYKRANNRSSLCAMHSLSGILLESYNYLLCSVVFTYFIIPCLQ